MLNSVTLKAAGYKQQPACGTQTLHPRKPSTVTVEKDDLDEVRLLHQHQFYMNTTEPLFIHCQKQQYSC